MSDGLHLGSEGLTPNYYIHTKNCRFLLVNLKKEIKPQVNVFEIRQTKAHKLQKHVSSLFLQGEHEAHHIL